MTDLLKENGINSIIVMNKSFELANEFENYETKMSELDGDPHCYVEVEGQYYYDAFDTDGVEEEIEMTYRTL
ncbi:MAG: hypothetical protein K9J21_07195 [Bacteroidales bacterium]|nr:hypothetical protein [Bacteroidales bacterium]